MDSKLCYINCTGHFVVVLEEFVAVAVDANKGTVLCVANGVHLLERVEGARLEDILNRTREGRHFV